MDAGKLALQVAHEYETRNPFKICGFLNIVVLRHPLIGIRGYYKNAHNVEFIVLADNLMDHVEQFVCAHELGHRMLHSGLNRVFLDSRTYLETSRYENSADRFACQLLWANGVQQNERSLTDWEISECLNVPKHTVNARLVELGIYS